MGKFVIRRLLQMILVLFGTTLVLFALLFIIPGDPVGTVGGGDKARDPAVRAELIHRYNLDKPLLTQYTTYVSKMARGDLGHSYHSQRPVRQILGHDIGRTIQLAFVAISIEIIIGLIVGILSAIFRYSFWDVLTTVATTFAVGVPVVVLGLILQEIFSIKTAHLHGFFRFLRFPPFGRHGWKSFVLPGFTLAVIDMAFVTRLMRGTLLEVLRTDYIRTARAKGLTERAVIMKHGLRNAVIPVLTYIGISFGGLLGGALVTEQVFAWGGIGSELVSAIQVQDNPIILAVTTYSVFIFVILSLVVDVAYAAIDPRIRLT
ncbi:MAG: ABC transporter permease [Actinomycetota bacterium]|nr:ABC transporter permease [Actinomycetota bacterium]